MLLYFRVSNSRSIGEEIELSMIAGEYDSLPDNVYHVEKYGFSVVKVMALYGANASGKSNILKAMGEGVDIITNGLLRAKEENPFQKRKAKYYTNKNNPKYSQEPTTYTYGLLISNVYYEYFLSVNSERILKERLWQFEPKQEIPITIFERKFEEESYLWFFDKQFDEKLKEVTVSVTNKYISWLSSANNYFENQSTHEKKENIKKIYAYFDNLQSSNVDDDRINFRYLAAALFWMNEDKSVKKYIIEVLKVADSRIRDIKVTIDKEGDIDTAYLYQLNYLGKKQKYDIFTEISTGTKELIALLPPFLVTCWADILLLADEFGNNLHPFIAKYLISMLYEYEGTQQLIFSTHHTELLDIELLRNDQVYFVNKNQEGDTTLKPLSDFQIGEDVLLDKVYLQGLLGGVPFISDKKR